MLPRKPAYLSRYRGKTSCQQVDVGCSNVRDCKSVSLFERRAENHPDS